MDGAVYRPTLLDLYCCEGGAATGYNQAGFNVFGVDIDEKALRRYPYGHHHGDALDYLAKHWQEYDAIHASPPYTKFIGEQLIAHMGNL